MKGHLIIGNLLLLTGSVRSNLDWIAGYDPLTFVSDHAAIDKDQRDIEKWLIADVFQQAERIYTEGGHSQSMAHLRLLNPEPPTQPFPVGTLVYGTGVDGRAVQGRLLKEAFWTKSDDQVILMVEYDREKLLEQYSLCQVGALVRTDSSVEDGCFVAAGEIQVLHYARNTPAYSYSYEYDIGQDNVNGRTIQEFSTNAFEEMWNCTNCPYDTFNKYATYYGMPDYGDRMVKAALHGKATKFALGNLDFGAPSRKSRVEAVKIATKFLNIWMYVIRMMEHALDLCELPCTKKGNVLYAPAQKAQCDDSPVRAWDQAVAFYAGSMEGESGVGDGVLLFDLADTMCARFMACGDDAELRFGISYANNVAINQFMKGQLHLLKRECGAARTSKNKIEKIMAVPLVQAALLNSYQQVYEKKSEEEEASKMIVAGSMYAATVLPLVHDCSPEDAQIIYENLRDNQTEVDFIAVKEAFERNYACMGVTCKAVGGIWEGRQYFPYASPCQDAIDTDNSSGIHFGIVIAAVGGILVLCALVYLSHQHHKKRIDSKYHDREPSVVPDDILRASRSMD